MKLGVIVDSFTASQNIFYMTKTLNELSKTDYIPCFGFYIGLSTVCTKTDFATMGIYYAQHFSGPEYNLIATSLKTLEVMKNLNVNARKIFYCWDLEWIRLNAGVLDYTKTTSLFKNVEIVARSKSHAENIENYSNCKVKYILDDWNIKELKEVLSWNNLSKK